MLKKIGSLDFCISYAVKRVTLQLASLSSVCCAPGSGFHLLSHADGQSYDQPCAVAMKIEIVEARMTENR